MDILQKNFAKAIKELAASAESEAELDVLVEAMPAQIQEILSELTDSMLNSIKQDASTGGLEERRRMHQDFFASNFQRWRQGFNALELLVEVCTEAGESTNARLCPEALENGDLVFDVSVRLHAKACLIAREIVCLLKNGFADGAHARWRAIHEVTVTAMFLLQRDRELAEKYLLHEHVEAYKGAIQYKKYEDKLQTEPISEEEIYELKKNYDAVLARFGEEFRNPYGWAEASLGKKRVNFSDLEEDVSLDHWRPYYKWASQNIHAGAKTIGFSLGMAEAKEDGLLTGPSNSGMTDPAHSMAISLAQITVAVLARSPNLDGLVMMKIILALSDEVGEEFLRCGGGSP